MASHPPLWKRIDGEPWMVNPLPAGFGPLMKRYIAKGLPAKEAMRRTWKYYKSGGGKNPLGEELVVVGALNPKRKEVRRMAKKVHHRRHRHNVSNPRHRTRWRTRTRTITKYRHRSNPAHRRHRRNPAAADIRIMKPMTWLPYMATAGVSATVTAAAPSMFLTNPEPWQAYGIQALVGIGGAIVLPMLRMPMHGLVWLATSGGIILADTIGRYAIKQFGLGERYYPPRLSAGGGMGLYPARVAVPAAYGHPRAPWR